MNCDTTTAAAAKTCLSVGAIAWAFIATGEASMLLGTIGALLVVIYWARRIYREWNAPIESHPPKWVERFKKRGGD